MSRQRWLWLTYPISWLGISIYSYTQTNPNLVLSSNQLYWQFQQAMWQIGYHHRQLSMVIYLVLLSIVFIQYFWLIGKRAIDRLSLREIGLMMVGLLIVLMPAYPALSNDIYNYLMNARMMREYQASPYIHPAWDFPDDPWLKFMMNVHTTTPYGIAWTAIGFVVYILTWGDLQMGMLGFRLLAIGGMGVVGWAIYVLSGKQRLPALMFLLNPLVIIEAAINVHNDMTMMAWLMLGIIGWQGWKGRRWTWAIISLIGGWGLSVYTKLVTIISPAIVVIYELSHNWLKKIDLAGWAFWGFLVAMYFDGAKRYFSWYLLWSICFFPLTKNKLTKTVGWLFSFSGLLSYWVYLYTGEYNWLTRRLRLLTFFLLPGIYLGMRFLVWVGQVFKRAFAVR